MLWKGPYEKQSSQVAFMVEKKKFSIDINLMQKMKYVLMHPVYDLHPRLLIRD